MKHIIVAFFLAIFNLNSSFGQKIYRSTNGNSSCSLMVNDSSYTYIVKGGSQSILYFSKGSKLLSNKNFILSSYPTFNSKIINYSVNLIKSYSLGDSCYILPVFYSSVSFGINISFTPEEEGKWYRANEDGIFKVSKNDILNNKQLYVNYSGTIFSIELDSSLKIEIFSTFIYLNIFPLNRLEDATWDFFAKTPNEIIQIGKDSFNLNELFETYFDEEQNRNVVNFKPYRSNSYEHILNIPFAILENGDLLNLNYKKGSSSICSFEIFKVFEE
jgi:hypothetical protein